MQSPETAPISLKDLDRATVRALVEAGYVPVKTYLDLANAGHFGDVRQPRQFQAPVRAYAQPMQVL